MTGDEWRELAEYAPDATSIMLWKAGEALRALLREVAWTWYTTLRLDRVLGPVEELEVIDDAAAVGAGYEKCTLILPDGTTCLNKSVRAGKLMTVAAALARLRGNQSAWVAPAEADEVLQQLAGKV